MTDEEYISMKLSESVDGRLIRINWSSVRRWISTICSKAILSFEDADRIHRKVQTQKQEMMLKNIMKGNFDGKY